MIDVASGSQIGDSPHVQIGAKEQPDRLPGDCIGIFGVDLEGAKFARYTLISFGQRRRLADEIARHVKIHQSIETEFERIGIDVHIGMVGEHAGLLADHPFEAGEGLLVGRGRRGPRLSDPGCRFLALRRRGR